MFDLALYYRMVGGWVGTCSTQLGRLRWAVTMGLYMALLSGAHREGWAQALIIFAACTVGTFLGRLISHSRFQATASFGNSLGMAVINVLRLVLIVGPYTVTDWLHLSGFQPARITMLVFGVMSGAAYYIGNKYLNGIDSTIEFDGQKAAVGGSEWGELLTGLLVYEAMFVFALVLI